MSSFNEVLRYDAVASFADRNENVHVYENYKGNMKLYWKMFRTTRMSIK